MPASIPLLYSFVVQ